MPRKTKVSIELKLKTVLDCLAGKININQSAQILGMDWNTIKDWINNYQSMGVAGLSPTSRNSNYSSELKLNAVKDYLSGQSSLKDICKKYRIRSHRQLRDWIMKYNSHNEIKSSNSGGNIVMTKGRTTTFEERIEVVKYCIEHERNYSKTAEKYQVSYQQARSWTIKYEECGIDTLIDRRGKRKEDDLLTETERLKAQNKLLMAQNKRLEIENEVLKKLEELERRWI